MTHDLIVLSDLHLSEGRPPKSPRYSPMEDFFFDEAFARFLEHLRRQYQGDPLKLKLVLNGDIFDFLTVTHTPSIAEGVSFEVSDAERRFGLHPTAHKSAYKMRLIGAGHPKFFKALAEFIAAGFQVVLLRGNHDLELFFPEVQEALKEVLVGHGLSHEALEKGLDIRQWFYLEEARVYIEHGNQYEASNSIRYPLRPLLPSKRNKAREPALNYPLGSFFVRYFYNPIHRLHPHTPKLIAFEQYLEFLRRYNFLEMIQVARAHFPFFLQAIRPSNPAGTSKGRKEDDAEQEEAFEVLDEESALPKLHQRLAELKIHPMSAAKAALVKEMIFPVLKRVVGLGAIALLSFYLWLVIFNTIQATSFLAESVFTKASLLALLALGTVTALFLFFSHVGRKMRRQRDETVENCAQKAKAISEITGAKLVLMGHTHVVDVRSLDGQVTYANSGTWTSVDNPWDRLHPDARRFTFLRVHGAEVEVLRWNDDALRCETVPLFALDEADPRASLMPGSISRIPAVGKEIR